MPSSTAPPDRTEAGEIERLQREVVDLRTRLEAREGEAAMLRVLLDQATRHQPAKACRQLATVEPQDTA